MDSSRALCRSTRCSAAPSVTDVANLHADKHPIVAGIWWVRDIQHNTSAVGSVDVTHSEVSVEQLGALQASQGLDLGVAVIVSKISEKLG